MLLFRVEYRDAILSGAKTTTLRAWRRRIVRGGTTTPTNLGFDVRVLAVEEVRLSDLGEQDARADGFPDLPALLAALRRHYGALPETLTRVRFETAPDASSTRRASPAGRAGPT